MAAVAISFVIGAVVVPEGPATASIDSDKAQIAQLEKQIAARGEAVQALVTRYNEVSARLASLNIGITKDEALVAADRRAQDQARATLQSMAVRAYITAGNGSSPALAIFNDSITTETLLETTRYAGAVGSKLDDAMAKMRTAQAQTRDDERSLQSQRDEATSTLHDLGSARDAANAAIVKDQALLTSVQGNLAVLLAFQAAQQRAAELAAERALAAKAKSTTPDPPISVPPPPPPPINLPPAKPGTYANPLRGVRAIVPERVDQGVDYASAGPIYAIGDGVVLSTSIPGWPGGTYIAYRLTDGPANGLVVYAAEDIQPTVDVGQHVTANTMIGEIYAGPDGIETGWGDPNAIGNTMARTYGQFSGDNSTAFGYNFSQFMQHLGAPGGILQNNPPTGSLPPNWPRW